MEYYIDFSGTLVIKARDEEEAEDKFWTWVEKSELENIELDLIEEKY